MYPILNFLSNSQRFTPSLKPTRLLPNAAACCFSSFSLLSPIAMASDKDSGTESLPEVMVTSTKIDVPAQYSTQSVTIITEDEIRERNYTDTTEILRQAAGIQFKQAGGPGQFNYPKLRGFGSGQFLVVVDGVKINEALSPGVSNFLGQIDPKLIERIEVLRGPQADLYGSDSTAGVIAITTKGALSGTHPELSAEYGSLSWKKGYGSLRGTQGDFGYSLNLAYTDSDGVIEREFYRNLSPQFKLGYQQGDHWSVEGSLLYMDTNFNYAELRESYAKDSPATPWWAFQLPDPNQFNQTEQTIGALNFKQQLTGNLRQKAVLGWTRKKNSNRDDNDGLLGIVPAPTDNFTLDYTNTYQRGQPVPVYDTGDGMPYYTQNENLQFDYNLLLDSRLAEGKNTALLGYEFYQQKGKKWGKYGDLDAEVANNALYINDILMLFDDALVIRAGLRFNQHEEYGQNTTGKLGASYTFKDSDSTLFANYGTSFRAPGFFELFDPIYGNPNVEPEEGQTIEAGLRQTLLGKRLNVELTYWRTELDNVIAFVGQVNPDGTFGGTYLNRDTGQSSGVELVGQYWINQNWNLNANYTYTDAWSEKNGERFQTVQVADNTANLGFAYQENQYSLGANLYYTGPRLRWNGDKETADYTRVDVFGRAQLNQEFTLYGRIENLFDQENTEEIGYQQPGIYALVGVEWKL